jgi:hypothetical protein
MTSPESRPESRADTRSDTRSDTRPEAGRSAAAPATESPGYKAEAQKPLPAQSPPRAGAQLGAANSPTGTAGPSSASATDVPDNIGLATRAPRPDEPQAAGERWEQAREQQQHRGQDAAKPR